MAQKGAREGFVAVLIIQTCRSDTYYTIKRLALLYHIFGIMNINNSLIII